jgi:hypothetical protein
MAAVGAAQLKREKSFHRKKIKPGRKSFILSSTWRERRYRSTMSTLPSPEITHLMTEK